MTQEEEQLDIAVQHGGDDKRGEWLYIGADSISSRQMRAQHPYNTIAPHYTIVTPRAPPPLPSPPLRRFMLHCGRRRDVCPVVDVRRRRYVTNTLDSLNITNIGVVVRQFSAERVSFMFFFPPDRLFEDLRSLWIGITRHARPHNFWFFLPFAIR